MADPTPVAILAASTASFDDAALERAAAFAREPFLSDGEDRDVVLAPRTPRRGALEAALAEIAEGAERPSKAWRRQWSLLLGLERVLDQDEPHLVDGTTLSAHQVDALSGTLTALLAEAQRGPNGGANGHGANGHGPESSLPLASAAVPGALELPEDLQEDEPEEEPQDWADEPAEGEEDGEGEVAPELADDPNAARRFWFEHATGAGKTVAALGFAEASRTGGVLILTHRRNLVDQFNGELRDRGYAARISPPLLGEEDDPNGPVTVETYQWFVRNAGRISGAYAIVICDEAHTALGEKTSAAIRSWAGPVFVGMTATGALIARHVTDLFPTQTSRFDLAQAARRGVISPLRSMRIPPGPGVRTIAKVPLRRGDVDTEFDQELLAELLDQLPFNMAVADLYKTRFDGVPGVIYSAGVRHAGNVAAAFRDLGMKAQAVSGETPKRDLARILADYERGDVDVLVNAQLLAEGWNSPRATVCMHLAPTASRRIYQQRVGRVTRRHPGKEAGIVIDFVHPATKHDDPVVTLHSLLDRDVYRGGAIVIGPVRRGRGRRLRVERRVVPVTADPDRRIEVFERELWRIAVEYLDWGEQIQWAALAGARVAPTGWRRARAMLQFDSGGELKRHFLLTAVERNKNPQLRLRALQEIATARDPEAFDRALELVGGWPKEEKREAVKVVLLALAEKKIGRRDQANNWIWAAAEMTREIHEEYAVQRWPETKRLLGLLVNSSGGAHARNARRLVHATRTQDRRLSAALLAAALPHTAEAGELINGARTRMSRKPAALARELLRNFPKAKGAAKRSTRRRKKRGVEGSQVEALAVGAVEDDDALETNVLAELDAAVAALADGPEPDEGEDGLEPYEPGGDVPVDGEAGEATTSRRKRSGRRRSRRGGEPAPEGAGAEAPEASAEAPAEETRSRRSRRSRRRSRAEALAAEAAVIESSEGAASPEATATGAEAGAAAAVADRPESIAAEQSGLPPAAVAEAAEAVVADEPIEPKRRARAAKAAEPESDAPVGEAVAPKPKRASRRKAEAQEEVPAPVADADAEKAPPKPKRAPRRKAAEAEAEVPAPLADALVKEAPPKPKRAPRRRAAEAEAEVPAPVADVVADAASPKPKPKRAPRRKAAEADLSLAEATVDEAAPKPKRTPRRKAAAPAAAEASGAEAPVDAATPPPKRATRRKVAATTEAPASGPATADASAPVLPPEATPKPRPTTRRKPTASGPAAEANGTRPETNGAVESLRPKRTRRVATPKEPASASGNGGSPIADASDRVRQAVLDAERDRTA